MQMQDSAGFGASYFPASRSPKQIRIPNTQITFLLQPVMLLLSFDFFTALTIGHEWGRPVDNFSIDESEGIGSEGIGIPRNRFRPAVPIASRSCAERQTVIPTLQITGQDLPW